MTGASRRMTTGFTLIEVLVALVIVGVTLSAAIRATTGMVRNTDTLRLKLYAEWSAENRLTEMRVSGIYPAIGTREVACPQGRFELTCVEIIQQTPNPTMRRMEVHVYADPTHEYQLASISTVIANAH